MVNTGRSKADAVSDAQNPARNSVMRRLASRGWAAVAALGMVVGLSVFNASPASADYVGVNTLRNWETGLCLSLVGGYVHTESCDQTNDLMRWEPIFIKNEGYDVVQLRNAGTHTCLSAEVNGTNVSLGHPSCSTVCWTCAIAQLWRAEGTGWDVVRFRSVSSGWYLDSNYSGNAYAHLGNDGGYQKWRLGY
ncbi:RICIN domain-containing protein [Streptomyces sp. NPDC051987]|uniref:RICIN domain-containing protein n=1 Tax=Streptomyces sp. NPDC051987 TaxID=3155808 RepID=UPI003448B9D8